MKKRILLIVLLAVIGFVVIFQESIAVWFSVRGDTLLEIYDMADTEWSGAGLERIDVTPVDIIVRDPAKVSALVDMLLAQPLRPGFPQRRTGKSGDVSVYLGTRYSVDIYISFLDSRHIIVRAPMLSPTKNPALFSGWYHRGNRLGQVAYTLQSEVDIAEIIAFFE
jgi:hypothetical protein